MEKWCMSQFDQAAPSFVVDQWVQGNPTNIDLERGNVILVEVFQVNCPGCFLYGLPAAIEIYQKFKGQALCVLGLATAFEDFDKNNLENLKKLVFDGEVVGETLNTMSLRDMLHGNRLQYSIPFPIAWDQVVDFQADIEETVQKMIHRDIPDFNNLPEASKPGFSDQVRNYVRNKTRTARTFESYALQGTPSTILIDRRGNLRQKFFGAGHELIDHVNTLLKE